MPMRASGPPSWVTSTTFIRTCLSQSTLLPSEHTWDKLTKPQEPTGDLQGLGRQGERHFLLPELASHRYQRIYGPWV